MRSTGTVVTVKNLRMVMLTRLQKDLILQEFDRYQRKTENLYEEMIWELSIQFGVDEDEVREVLEKE